MNTMRLIRRLKAKRRTEILLWLSRDFGASRAVFLKVYLMSARPKQNRSKTEQSEKLKKSSEKAVLIYRNMRSYITKLFLVLAFVSLFYFFGIQGCSPSMQMAGLGPISCEDFPERFGCNVEEEEILYPGDDEEGGEGYPPENHERVPPGERERTVPGDGERAAPGNRGGAAPGNNERPPVQTRPPQPRRKYLNFKYTVPSGKVDILFVIDNSSSMAEEHRSLATQFLSFLHNLKHVDYHIAVITTDISDSPGNPVRSAIYQDGNFIPIGRRRFLRNENKGDRISKQTIQDFQKAISRPETKRCDRASRPRRSSGNPYIIDDSDAGFACPSHDERGFHAIYRAILDADHRSFFRSDAHLMIVILSDEDNRSGEYYYSQPGFEEYEPTDEYWDTPESLVEAIYNRLGKLKSFSVYPIIIPPGDSECLGRQNINSRQGEGTGKGYYGLEYARLARAEDSRLTRYGNLVRGEVLSICHKSYSSQLNRVALSANTVRMPLPCGNPLNIELFVDGKRKSPRKRIEGRTLILEPGIIRLGADMQLKVRCLED